MTTVHSFPPIVDRSSHTLILGSMPGVASLRAVQYYAHPRNAFWPIMGALFGAGPEKSYDERTAILLARGIAVWDVVKLCTRRGSLDSAIVDSTVVTNDFDSLLGEFPSIRRIVFNGAKAETSFVRHVAPSVRDVAVRRLPSTSPAHASLSFDRKLDAWRTIAQPRPAISGSYGRDEGHQENDDEHDRVDRRNRNPRP
ncbi:DNA-deoxyinosine glycosylase [Rhodococcus sp. 15-1154-1]|nr:DNA-deoxyinosine glycosylase [Rhodococcus sp. 15-1154-1]OZF00207.1 DNA-deoxyinosine glycosylase [Rhodococcus sp. 15-1154-1]